MRGERFKDGLKRYGPYDLELLGVSRWKCGYFCLEGMGFTCEVWI